MNTEILKPAANESNFTGEDWDGSLNKSEAETPFCFCEHHSEIEATHLAKCMAVEAMNVVTIPICQSCADELVENCGNWIELVKIKK